VADERATSAVVGKALEAALVVLYVGVLASALFGGAVPEYRSAAGAEVGERVLAEASQRVQQTVPANATAVEARTQVDLPETIRGRSYEVRVDGRSLVLDHPDPVVAQSTPLALPETVVSVEGNWTSHERAVVAVERADSGLVVRLVVGD
jgi:hypothetical protein